MPSGLALHLPHDKAFGGEIRRVTERRVRSDRLLALNEQGPDIVGNRALRDEGPRGDIPEKLIAGLHRESRPGWWSVAHQIALPEKPVVMPRACLP